MALTPHSYTNNRGEPAGNKTQAIAGDDPFTYIVSGVVWVAAHHRGAAIEMVKWWGLPTRGPTDLIRGDDLFIYIDTGTKGGGGGESIGGGGGWWEAHHGTNLLVAADVSFIQQYVD